MLNYKNENWWVYNLGLKICSVIGIIAIIICIMNKGTLDYRSTFLLMNVQHIMLMMILVLNGTKEVFAKNSKE